MTYNGALTPHGRATLVAEYLRQREGLLAAFPELLDDVQALADTLEGEAEAPDVIARFVRDSREDAAMANALSKMLHEMGERRERFVRRAERRRQAALQIMQACELRNITMPDFTASVRAVPPKVEVIDEAALPDSLCKIVRYPDKVAIKEALAQGPVAGAVMGNGGISLTIRTS